jgi:hypothetical protein
MGTSALEIIIGIYAMVKLCEITGSRDKRNGIRVFSGIGLIVIIIAVCRAFINFTYGY